MMTLSRRNVLQLAAGAAVPAGAPARRARAKLSDAADHAGGSIRARSGTDAVVARIMGRWLSPRLGQTVVWSRTSPAPDTFSPPSRS
jgi:hypothetical protein